MPLWQIHIVDDNQAAATVTQRGLQILLGARACVSITATPDAAWLACAAKCVDLLIVDPGPHIGWRVSLLRAVRALRPEIPILVLTAYDNPGLRSRLHALGVSLYLAKPTELEVLLPTVLDALARSPVRRPSGRSLATLGRDGQAEPRTANRSSSLPHLD